MEILKQLSDKKIIFGLILLQLAVSLPFITSFQDLSEFIPVLNKGNNPPLHFVLLHFWIKLFGISPLAVRSLSLLISLIVIPVLFNFSKQIVKKPLVIFTVGLYIFSSFNHYHNMEARVYVMLLLFVLLIFKTLYDFLFLVGVELILLVIFYKYLSIKKVKQYILSGLLSLLLFLPVLVLLFKRLGHFTSEGTWVEKPHITELYGNIIRFFNGTIPFFITVGLVLVLVIFNRNLIKSIKFESKYVFIFLCFGLPYLIFCICLLPLSFNGLVQIKQSIIVCSLFYQWQCF